MPAHVEPVNRQALFEQADIVVLCCPLNEQTKGLVDAATVALLKPTAILINVSRGPVIDTAAVLAALRQGHLGGAALDVFTAEPLPADSPLRDQPNVLLSPHMAGSTNEAAMRLFGQTKANLARVLAGEPVVNVVNGVDPQVSRRC